jgi:signal transduction histidine kinase
MVGLVVQLDAIGFDPDNNLSGVFVCVRHLTGEAISNILDNAIKYAPLRRGDGGGTQQGKRLVGSRPRIPHIRVTLESNKPPLAPGATL